MINFNFHILRSSGLGVNLLTESVSDEVSASRRKVFVVDCVGRLMMISGIQQFRDHPKTNEDICWQILGLQYVRMNDHRSWYPHHAAAAFCRHRRSTFLQLCSKFPKRYANISEKTSLASTFATTHGKLHQQQHSSSAPRSTVISCMVTVYSKVLLDISQLINRRKHEVKSKLCHNLDPSHITTWK